MVNYCMILVYSLLVLLFGSAAAGTVTSNIPVIVSPIKNYTSASPQWLTSPFFRAGNEAVIKVLTGNDTTPTYTFTFSSALPGLPNLAYGIKNYRGNDYFGQEFYEIKKIGLTEATFKVAIQIYGVTNLWVLTVAYLAVDPTFPHHLNSFDNVPINYTAGDIVNITEKRFQLAYYTNYINYTEQAEGMLYTKFTTPYSSNNIVLFMTSLWIRGTFKSGSTYYPVRFHITTGVVNESFYFWNATLEINVLVTNVHFSQVIFNTDDVESSKKYFIVYKTWTNDMEGGFIEIPEAFVDNFIMGVTAFETIDGSCGFEYQWEFSEATVNGTATFGVQMLRSWTPTNTCGFSWSLSSMFYMQTWLCAPPFYYFNLTSGLCQTLCGGFTYEKIATFTCEPCLDSLCYSCEEPARNLCTDCASYLFYELVNSSCRCMSGYFPSASLCTPCKSGSAGCLTCSYDDGANGTLAYNSTKFACLTCNNSANYFLVTGARCQLCTLSNCVVCLNLTACTACTATYFPSVDLICVHCYVAGCAYCTTSNANACAVCNLTMGYYLSGQSCITQCGDGIVASAVEQCDDNNTASYDGCSSACSTEASFSCSGAPSVCYFASSAAIALTDTIVETAVCDTITFTFQLTPASSTFAQPFVNWTDFLVTPNASLITLNTSMFQYSNGKLSVSYSMQATIQNLSLSFSTNYSSLVANSSIFNQTESNSLFFAVVPTNNRQALLECCVGYVYNSSISDCSEICGDGMVWELPCDDGNVVNGDGCSSYCEVETDYSCLNGSSSSPSVCCFNGSIAVEVSSAIKDPNSNTLSIAYTLSPVQPVLNLINNSYDFLPYLSLSHPAATIVAAAYNPSTGTVNVVVSYNQSIQGQPLDLSFHPPSVPTASLLPAVGSSWKVAPTNRLSASFYPDSTYSRVKQLQPYSSAVLALYLTICLITLFFRKFIGLELAALLQLGYLSLTLNSQLPPYLHTVSTWQYVFGYNYFYLSGSGAAVDSSYSAYGYQKYFGFSCNVMVLAIAGVYGLSLLLVCLSAVTTKALSRKLQSAGFTLLNEVGFALVVFSTPNILTALCIEARAGALFDTSLLWSKAFLCIGAAAVLLSNAIALANAEESSDVGTFFRKHSRLGVYAPLLFNLRLVLLTVALFLNEAAGSAGSLLALALQSLYLVFVLFGRPHKKPYDLARALALELSLLFVLLTRYLAAYALNQAVSPESALFEVLSIIELAAYGLGVVVSLVSLVYHLVKRFKRNKVEPNDGLLDEASPEKVGGQAKAEELSKEGLRESSPSKRRINEQNASSIVFDVEDMEGETNEPGTTGPSEFKFDPRKQERKYRRRR